MTRVERRDPKALDHKMTIAELEKLSPAFRWQVYFTKVGMPSIASLNVSVPAFIKTMNEAIEKESLAGLENLPTLASGARQCSPSVLRIPQ